MILLIGRASGFGTGLESLLVSTKMRSPLEALSYLGLGLWRWAPSL